LPKIAFRTHSPAHWTTGNAGYRATLLNHARSPARLDASGAAIPLEHQDRSNWDQDCAHEGLTLIETALRRGRPGPFQLQAAISAIHVEAVDFKATRWDEIALIYDRLYEFAPNPVVALNRAVAVSFAQGPCAGLANLPEGLENYQSLHAARADMLRRLGQIPAARAAYDRALALTGNGADRLLLEKNRDALTVSSQTRV
jgi:RNA polymerase sigma-70 factor (ECF subfamily)